MIIATLAVALWLTPVNAFWQEFLLRELTEDLLNGQTKNAASEVSVVCGVCVCRVAIGAYSSGQLGAGGDTLSTGRIPAGVDDATGRH
jgi:hypothetical protein